MNLLSIAHWLMKVYRVSKLASLPRKESWQKVAHGIWMRITPNDFMDQGFLLGNYEPVLVYFITQFIYPGDVCIDVGAQKGYFTLQLAKAVKNKGHVIAIDPDYRAIDKLTENCERNNFQHITVCNLAVGDIEGMQEFSFSEQLGYSSRFPNEVAKPLIRSIDKVNVKPLDKLLSELGITQSKDKLSFIKIDAEGSEPLIIKGMNATMTHFKPVLWIEVNPESLHSAGLSANSIQGPLIENGYEIYKINFHRDNFLRSQFSLVKVGNLMHEIIHNEDVLAIHKNSQYYERLSLWLNPS